jgi:hypothetical protein
MGLKKSTLKKEIQDAIEQLLPPALEQGINVTFPRATESGEDIAKKFADTVTEILAAPMAEALAAAIDYHVKSADVYGNLITNGSPSTHFCTISSPSPITNGKVPNSLGIK